MKNKIKKILAQTKEMAGKAAGITITILVYGTCAYLAQGAKQSKRKTIIYRYPKSESPYGNAVEAITQSDMFSCDKEKALKYLADDKTESYYDAVISIASSDMFSNDKVETIRALSQ